MATRSVTLSVTPHLVRLPHLPLAASLRCHLRAVTSTTDRHQLRRWSLLHFFTQKSPHSTLDRFPAKQRETHIKTSTKRLSDTLNLRKKYGLYRETTVYQHPQFKFVVYPQATHYDSIQNLCTMPMFYPLQSFGYQSRLISSYLCMLSLLGLNYVGSEHDTDSPCTNTYPLRFLIEVLTIPALHLVSSL